MKTQNLILFAALTLSLVTPLQSFAGPLEEDPTTSECAKNSTDLRRIFATEMDILKNFEGIWSDVAPVARADNAKREGKTREQMNQDFRSRAIGYNANKSGIKFQTHQTGQDVRQKKVSKPIDVKICKTRQGVMRVLGEGIEIDLQILSPLDVLIRDGKSWRRYHRSATTMESDKSFLPAQDTLDKQFEPLPGIKAHSLEELVADPTKGIS